MAKDPGNPYRIMYRWILQEIQELNAMRDCTNGLTKIESIVKDLKAQIFDLRELLVA